MKAVLEITSNPREIEFRVQLRSQIGIWERVIMGWRPPRARPSFHNSIVERTCLRNSIAQAFEVAGRPSSV